MINILRSKQCYIYYITIVSIAVLQFASCSLLPRASTIAYILPRETDVPGWVIAKQYRTSSLKKNGQINTLYTEYDPVELIVAEYGRLSDISKTVRIEIIRFRSALDSFGIFSRERGLNGMAHSAGDDSCSSDNKLYFRQGKYYTRITGENLDAQETGAIEQFQGVVRQNLKKLAGEEVLPDSLYLFSDDRSTMDIVYFKKGIDTIPGLKNISVMRRSLGGKKFDIIYTKLPTAFDAEQEFHKILKTGGNAFILTKIGSLQPALRIISDSEYLFISYYKQWIFGVLNADTMNEGSNIIVYLFGEIKIKITKKEKNG